MQHIVPDTTTIAVTAFGGAALHLRATGEAVTLGMKAIGLVIYIAEAAPRMVLREFLVELFWERSDAIRGGGSLRQELRRIKMALGAEVFDATFDVTDMHVGLKPGRFSYDGDALIEVASSEDPAQLVRILDLYVGDFLADNRARAESFQEWANTRRIFYRERALAGLLRLGVTDLAAGRVERAQQAAERIVEIEPLHEPGHELLIRCHVVNGRRGAAREHFERFRSLLLRELAMEPEATLADLVTLQAAVAPPASPPPPRLERRPRGRSTIAMLNVSRSLPQDLAYLAIGVSKKLLTSLSKSSWLRVATLNPNTEHPFDADLDDFQRRWLRACAVYPVLRWPLTVFIGRRLADHLGLTKPDLESHVPLARLDWFRLGRIPEEERARLVADIASGDRAAIRAIYAEALADPAARGVSGRLDAGRDDDPVFAQFMLAETPLPIEQAFNTALDRVYGRATVARADARVWAAGAAAVLAAALLGVGAALATVGWTAPGDESRLASIQQMAEQETIVESNDVAAKLATRIEPIGDAAAPTAAEVREAELLRSLVASFDDCGGLTLHDGGPGATGPFLVVGRISGEDKAVELGAALRKIAGDRGALVEAETLDPDVCRVMKLLPAATAAGLEIRYFDGSWGVEKPNDAYGMGEFLIAAVALPPGLGGRLSAFIAGNNGHVINLLPHTYRPDDATPDDGAARLVPIAFPLREASGSRVALETAEPPGVSVIVALVTDEPLFDPPRLISERVEEFEAEFGPRIAAVAAAGGLRALVWRRYDVR